jgi:endonuclease/exonuclease/phosphatase family metal-dependent hydrolase
MRHAAGLHNLTAIVLTAGLTACVHVPPMVAERAASACRQTVPETVAPMTWVRPSAERDRMRLDQWCDAVGPAIVLPSPSALARPVDRLAIVVWNVRVGDADVARLLNELKRGAFTKGETVEDFVLLLQETYRSGPDVPARPPEGSHGPMTVFERPEGERRSVLDLAGDYQLAAVYVPSMRNAGMIDPKPAATDRGNAILSTVTLTEPMAIELPFERQRRVAVAATAQSTTRAGVPWQLRLVNVHLDTSLALTRGGPATARQRQAAALVEALGPLNEPTILAGDFNSWMGLREPAVRDLRRVFNQTPPASRAATWYGPMGTRFLLDHVFARNLPGPIAVTRLPDRYGSDHHPLLAIVDVRTSSSLAAQIQ